MLSIGVCVFANVYWMIAVLVIGFLVQYTPIIRSEETYLLKLCGDRYRAYCATVPRLIPHPRPYVLPSDHDFSLRRALKSEKRTLTAILMCPHLDRSPVVSVIDAMQVLSDTTI